MKRKLITTGTRSLIYAALAAALSITSIGWTHAAGDADGSSDGSSGGGDAPVTTGGIFDEAESYVPPEELPIKDTYIKDSMAESAEEMADDLETVAISPDGEVTTDAVSPEEMEMLREAIDTFEEGAEGFMDVDGAGDSETEGESLAESVIGKDTRSRVYSTTSVPYRKQGRIDIGCTGTLIGPRHVLTAGHCVYNIKTDKWYKKLSFSPGQKDSSTRPYGKIAWKRAVTVKGWTKDHKRDHDYAMIILKKDVGKQVGWMSYGWKSPMPKYNININGYPGDKPTGTMWHSYCKMKKTTGNRLYYACDTYGGMSGSSVYVYFKSKKKRTIYGIHAYGVDSTGYNGATRITKTVFNKLKAWKKKYP